MDNASKMIEKGSAMRRQKSPQQFLTTSGRDKQRLYIQTPTPRIDLYPQNEHQENHPTPPGKRIPGKLNKSGRRYKDTIDNITKQMLAGSHAGRIANQLHNLNRRATVHIEQQQTNGIKINQNHFGLHSKKSLGGIQESQSKSLDDNLVSPRYKLDNPLTETEHKEASIDPETKTTTKTLAEPLQEEDESKMEMETKMNEDEKHNPYFAAVLEIKKMTLFETPEDKIQCVVRTADIIKVTIDEFYENRRTDPIQITPDDLLSLFAYILTQANLHCLWAEVDLIDDFVVDNLRMDMPGYYIATLRAAMQLIVNDIEKLTQTSMKKRSSMKNIPEL
eukprot:CAMPEP_0201576310 /NCGR_PEP_ID=MMETSP0190_2-20130828/22059_1 /ASSEMBLY_ACC=CAM_ASM_000263 /TAXON_ID=37353 /ORGANISM="Rosalina sp." /LENGTH=333 /DNA_ID=CAMNT_0048007037 /DNA_START=45 /DNA_END=1046 /DNA_ORIENTATION=-